MNRRFILAAVLSLVAGTILLGLLRRSLEQVESVDVTDKDLAEARLKIQGPAAERPLAIPTSDQSRVVRLAIGSLGWPDEDLNRTVGDLTTAALTDAKDLELVERQALNQVLQELHLSLAGLVRAKDAVAAGKLLRADWFLLGSVVQLGTTNELVVRIVDASTGTLRDAGVVSADQTPMKIASDLAGFVRQSRQAASQGRPRTYLAIGTFEDLSLNNRRADFPSQLRGYLVAAYRNSQVSLLEREYVEALLQEVRLDLAGLTDPAGSQPSRPMQSAFWLVTGQFQSYETDQLQVEVLLDIHRMFGGNKRLKLRGLPLDPIGAQVKTAIDESLNSAKEILAPTRATEARVQMGVGKDLAEPLVRPGEFGLIYNGYGALVDEAEALQRNDVSVTRRRRNFQEAIRAFQTVLLLEPTNCEAKVRLAACLRDPVINRSEEARQLYRELIEGEFQDHWADVARKALVASFYWGSSTDAAKWFAWAAQQTANATAAEFYRRQAAAGQAKLAQELGDASQLEGLAEQHLFEGIAQFKHNYILDLPAPESLLAPSYQYCMGMDDFAKSFGQDRTQAAAKLVELLPKMTNQAPDLGPYLLATVVSFQVDPNAPVVGQFSQNLGACIEHPSQLLKPQKYWQYVRWQVWDWCLEKTNSSIALQLLEGERRAATEGYIDFGDEEKVKLAFAYLDQQRWKDALGIFETFSGQPVKAPPRNGPWGRAWAMIRTDQAVAYCRKQLGLEISRDSRQFEMGPNCLCLHTPSAFAVDDQGLWLAIGGQLLRLDLTLKTNLTVTLPIESSKPITSLRVGRQKVWIGTDGAGLIACDKADGRCNRLTVADGLMMDSVSDVYEAGELLWIGYGGRSGGGLGQLDLPSGKFKSYMRSLVTGGGQGPPNGPVANLTLPNGTDVWMYTSGSIRLFHPDSESWETTPRARNDGLLYTYAANPDWVVEGVTTVQAEIEVEDRAQTSPATNGFQRTKFVLAEDAASVLLADIRTNAHGRKVTFMSFDSVKPKPGLVFRPLHSDQWQLVEDPVALPNTPTAVTIDHDEAWVGGEGYLARVDLKRHQVRNFARISADSVARIQVAGGFVWAQYDKHLHRAPLP